MKRRTRARASRNTNRPPALAWVAAAGLGFVLGGVGSCDEPEPATATCTDWLRCYVDCRDGQYARGDDQAVDREVLLDICENECIDIAREAPDWPSNIYLAVENPEDVGFFWERMSFCLNGDG